MKRRLLGALLVLCLVSAAWPYSNPSNVYAATTVRRTIIDFEGSLQSPGVVTGVDPRGSLGAYGNMNFSPLYYAWENPPSFVSGSDDINYWTVSTNATTKANGISDFVDYNISLSGAWDRPQNWSKFTKLNMKTWVRCETQNCNRIGFDVYVRNTISGNNNGQYHYFGTVYWLVQDGGLSSFTLDLSQMPQRSSVDEVKIRVKESNFDAELTGNRTQIVHMFNIEVEGSLPYPPYPTVSLPSAPTSAIGPNQGRGYPSYDYSATIMDDNGTQRMWWCGLQTDGGGDAIWYSTSTNGGSTWSAASQVLVPTEPSAETQNKSGGHTCDPSVVKVNNLYYMYYTSAGYDASWATTDQIFLATATNPAGPWSKYRVSNVITPVIPFRYGDISTIGYGIGQSSVMWLNGRFYHYYTYEDKTNPDPAKRVTPPKEMLALSMDGVNWYNAVKRTPVSSGPDQPVFGSSAAAPIYLRDYNLFLQVESGEGVNASLPDRLRYVWSTDGINWSGSSFYNGGGAYEVAYPAGSGARSYSYTELLTDPMGRGNGTQLWHFPASSTGDAALGDQNTDIYRLLINLTAP